MPRFFLPPEQCHEASLTLTGREAHHALHVLRIRQGQRITVLNGAGTELLCDVQDCQRDEVTLTVTEKRASPPRACQITLLQAIPKGKTFETIIQKAAELGAFCVVPLLSERVAARLDQADAGHKLQKWRLAAIEAIKQCGSPWLPIIESPVTPQQFIAQPHRFDPALLASLQPDAKHPSAFLRIGQPAHRSKPRSICIWIGPEGDFTPAESEAIKASGALPMTLGPLVLRTDTAAVYCLSIINYELSASIQSEA